jgi:hypothetical protein
MGLEGDHDRRQAQLPRPGHDLAEDGALAAVHAVEVADRADAAARQVAAVERVLNDVHGDGIL